MCVKDDAALKRVYLIGQDYSFGQAVLREARRQLGAQRPDVQIVGDELHPMRPREGLRALRQPRSRPAAPQAVITGNWGNDLTLLVKAAREVGFDGKFYTFYGNALGAPAAIGDAGIGTRDRGGRLAAERADARRARPSTSPSASAIPKPADDYVHMRMQLMVEALAQAIEQRRQRRAVAGGARAGAGRRQPARARRGRMRAADHQFQQPLVVGVMDRQGTPGVKFDVEGSGYGFRVVQDDRAGAGRDAHHAARCVRP